jgi:hypothetical protein
MTKFEILMAINLCYLVYDTWQSPSRRSDCQLEEHSADHIHTFHHSTKENVMLNAEEALLLLPFSNFRDYTLRLLPSLKLEKVLGSRHGIHHIINV